MELFFTDNSFTIAGTSFVGVPFFVDSQYKLLDEINEFFTRDLLIDGKISSSQTWKNYAYWLLDYFRWAEANGVNWKVVNTQEIIAYRNWSLEKCNLSPFTVNLRITVLKRFYKYSVENSLVNSTPISTSEIKRISFNDSNFLSHVHQVHYKRNNLSIKTTTELPKFFSDEELVQIFSAAFSERLKLIMLLMLECGLRRKEVSKLPDSAIELTINLAQKLGQNSEIPLKLPAHICKGKKSRTVFLSYPTIMRLMHYRNTIRPKYLKRYKLNFKCMPEAFWLTQLGTEYKPESLSMEINMIGKRLGIDANPHKFRHTFATNYFAISKDLRSLQKFLGHENIQTTTIYEHTSVEDRFGHLLNYQRHLDSLLIN